MAGKCYRLTDRRTDRRTRSFIEMRGRIEEINKSFILYKNCQLQEYVRRGRAGKLTDALEMRNGCETKIQAKKDEKEALEGKQKANDEQIIGQDSQRRNIEVRRKD